MVYDYKKEFLEEMKGYKYGCKIAKWDIDIIQIVWYLKSEVKELFPVNKVPNNVIHSLDDLTSVFTSAEKKLKDTLDIIIQEVKNLDGIED